MHRPRVPSARAAVPWIALLAVLWAGTPLAANDTLVIRMRPALESRLAPDAPYKTELLRLILEKTEAEDGPYRIEYVEETVQGRVIEMINTGDMSLIITMTSQEREDRLRPIRIPVFKGLYGYRALIINRADQARFEAIQSVEELKALWAGQGHDWPDLEILQANGFNVVGGSDYHALFDMLAKRRFDYFPRGLHEPWLEVAEHPDLDLIVDRHLIIHYPAPGYIFVAKDNAALAERLERGFRAAIADGSFDAFFRTHPDMTETLALGQLDTRLIFEVPNPLLSPETPLDQPELWYRP